MNLKKETYFLSWCSKIWRLEQFGESKLLFSAIRVCDSTSISSTDYEMHACSGGLWHSLKTLRLPTTVRCLYGLARVLPSINYEATAAILSAISRYLLRSSSIVAQ